MKRNLFFISAFFCLCACVPRAQLREAERQLDSLNAENERSREEAELLTHFVDVISEGLDSIAHQENILFLPDQEQPEMKQSEVLDNLQQLEVLVRRQRERIKELEDSLATNNNETTRLHALLTHLKRQLQQKEEEVLYLKTEMSKKDADLSKLRNRVRSLESDVSQLSSDLAVSRKRDSVNRTILRAQDDYLNQGLYLIATRKELTGYGIDRNGIMTPDVSDAIFTSVDIRTFAQLTIPSQRVKILSSVPPSSYMLTKNGDGTTTLEIFDPVEFWKTSKYLIIQIR